MSAIYPLWMMEEVMRSYGKPDQRKSFLMHNQELENALDPILEPYQNSAWVLMHGLNICFQRSNFWPWAMVAFPREVPLAGFIAAFRESREEVVFTPYQIAIDHNPQRDGPPLVGVVSFRTPEALLKLGEPDIYFQPAYRALEQNKDGGNWLYINDPIDSHELERAKHDDRRLYLDSLER